MTLRSHSTTPTNSHEHKPKRSLFRSPKTPPSKTDTSDVPVIDLSATQPPKLSIPASCSIDNPANSLHTASDDTIPPVPALPPHIASHNASIVRSSTPDSVPASPASANGHSLPFTPSSTTSTLTVTTPGTSSNPTSAINNIRGRVVDRNSGSISSRSTSQPPTSSRSSIALTSPEGLVSSRTSTSSANVKFAPLPELNPRRRKSSTPLGVASRSQMMKKRRQMMQANENYAADDSCVGASESPMWTNEEIELHLRRQMIAQEEARRRAHYEPLGREEDEIPPEEDPIVALGKAMKHAWRKMSGGKEHPKKPKRSVEEEEEENAPGRVVVDPQKRETIESILARPLKIEVHIDSPWEEEVSKAFVRKLLDTENEKVISEEERDSGLGSDSSRSSRDS